MAQANKYQVMKQPVVAAPLISAIIPTHNRKDDVLAALRSVSAQTYPNLEIIVVDDGSSDGTLQGLVAYQREHEARMRIVAQPTNRGVSAARNRGVAEASGEIIAFLDDDDTWVPEKLAVQWGDMQKNPDGNWLCLTNVFVKQPDGEVVTSRAYSDNLFDPEKPLKLKKFMAQRCLVLPSTWMMPKRTFDKLGGFDVRMPCAEDGELVIRHLRAGGHLRMVNTHLTTYTGPGPNKIRAGSEESYGRFIALHYEWMKETCSPMATELMRRAQMQTQSPAKPSTLGKSSFSAPRM